MPKATPIHFECWICNRKSTELWANDFSDYTCEFCGQKYSWDEGHQLVLTKHQLAILKADAEQPKEYTEPSLMPWGENIIVVDGIAIQPQPPINPPDYFPPAQ